MHLPFSLHGRAGEVSITVDATRDPGELGASPGALGLAHCQATVEYAGRGYSSMLGWIQLVRSTDNGSGGKEFEMDPLMFVGAVPHPFAFFGVAPTLFDAPARRSRADLDWLAHSFLCHLTEIDEEIRTVEAITGFSWGFGIAGGAATVEPARALQPADWNGHRKLLHAQHPGWRFRDGFPARP
ncbi:hypothetical protein [Actinoplanes derwentensis]|uniref:Uncharacterized protein n=1 Tax=Actinoplanes derwentensis TaxID=113562 RepID=A0A1H1YMY7_9ACTN|nr:hypothetical protein [Actinoplanes derwentensis]GID81213.1 hypothetical protein Ade03nite_01370 [Actinoplanes derwentensis]SDT22764.1 hypothetical protein SAMN04489716_2922 [Actinoplanes derwentensis]